MGEIFALQGTLAIALVNVEECIRCRVKGCYGDHKAIDHKANSGN